MLGRCARFTSPRRQPSTGSNHCSITHGQLGYGDVRLAATLNMATTAINIQTLNTSLLISTTGAAIWAITTRPKGPHPYGPWLIAGALIALTVSET